MNKFAYYFSVLVIILAMIGVAYFFFVILYPFKTVNLEQPIKVLNANKEVQRGGDLQLEIIYEKFGNYTVKADKNYICEDGSLVTLASNTTNLPQGKQRFIISLSVPQKMTLGKCYLQYTNVYEVSPLRNITKVWVTETFEVVTGGEVIE